MKIQSFLLSLSLGVVGATTAFGSTVAIVDSGVDYRHVKIASNQWVNEGELGGSRGSDDDGNSLVDDLYGWNFAENNNLVIDYKYLGTFSDDPYRFFEVQLKMFLGTASQADVEWLKSKREDQEFLQELMKFANFVHGTHVAGIAVKDSKAKEIAVKLIPTEVKPFIVKARAMAKKMKLKGDEKGDEMAVMMIKMLLGQMASQQNTLLTTIGTYVGGHKSQVANGSFGTGYAQAEMIVGQLFTALVGREPTEDEMYDICTDFLNKVLEGGVNFVKAAPETLFVFAAGNDGSNNDIYPASPANVREANSMTVAALLNHHTIASFSNFGTTHVDVAAPGVGITSAIPGDEFLRVSGTSQAAPYVTNVAARIFDLNKDLSAADVKKIIMETVDKKDFLKTKVKSGGLVNLARAVRAAELSVDFSLTKSIAQARAEIADEPDTKGMDSYSQMFESLVLPIPSMFQL